MPEAETRLATTCIVQLPLSLNVRVTACRVPTVGASVARHNYKKILVEKTSTFIVVTTGTQEHRKIGTRGKDTAPISSI